MEQAYSTYKDSGVEWIGEVPESWEIGRLYYFTESIGSGSTPKSDNLKYYNGDISWLNTGDLNDGEVLDSSKYITQLALNDYSALKIFPKNSVVIALYGATIGKLGIIKKDMATNQACCVINPDESLNSQFLFYFLLASRNFLLSLAYGGGQPNISQDIIKKLHIPFVGIKEQTQIAAYLDYHTRLIDALIAKKETLIQKLQEQRQAIINEAVTKGLNKNVALKDSGIEWLGDIPEHWEVVKLKFVINELESGVSVNSEGEIVNPNGSDYGILKTSAVFAYDFNPFENKKVVENEINRLKCPVRKDSIIISRMNTPDLVGSLGYVKNDYDNLFLPDRLWQTVIEDKSEIDVEFLCYILKSDLYRKLVSSKASGTSPSMKNITKSDFLESPIPLIPIEEQLEIKEYLLSNDNSVNILLENVKTSIQKLKDYRQSLISEAVTGKIDVREWQQPNS